MDMILTILIVTLSSLVLMVGALYVIGTVAMAVVAAVDATVVGIRHRYGQAGRLRGTHYGTPAMHH